MPTRAPAPALVASPLSLVLPDQARSGLQRFSCPPLRSLHMPVEPNPAALEPHRRQQPTFARSGPGSSAACPPRGRSAALAPAACLTPPPLPSPLPPRAGGKRKQAAPAWQQSIRRWVTPAGDGGGASGSGASAARATSAVSVRRGRQAVSSARAAPLRCPFALPLLLPVLPSDFGPFEYFLGSSRCSQCVVSCEGFHIFFISLSTLDSSSVYF